MSDREKAEFESLLPALKLRKKACSVYLASIRELGLDETDVPIVRLLTCVRPASRIPVETDDLLVMLYSRLPWWHCVLVTTVLDDIGVYLDDPAVFALMETAVTGGLSTTLDLSTRLELATCAQGWGVHARRRIWLLSCGIRAYVGSYIGFLDQSN